MVSQRDKQERGQHKAGKQMPGAEAGSGRGQLCAPPRQKRKGKAWGPRTEKYWNRHPWNSGGGSIHGRSSSRNPCGEQRSEAGCSMRLGARGQRAEENLASPMLSSRGRLNSLGNAADRRKLGGCPTCQPEAEHRWEAAGTPRAERARVRELLCPTAAASPSLGPAEPLTYHEQCQNTAGI